MGPWCVVQASPVGCDHPRTIVLHTASPAPPPPPPAARGLLPVAWRGFLQRIPASARSHRAPAPPQAQQLRAACVRAAATAAMQPLQPVPLGVQTEENNLAYANLSAMRQFMTVDGQFAVTVAEARGARAGAACLGRGKGRALHRCVTGAAHP